MHQFIFGKEKHVLNKEDHFVKKLFYEMPYERSIDIDSLSDFKLVEFFGK